MINFKRMGIETQERYPTATGLILIFPLLII